MTTTILAIGIVYTPIFARVARASTLSVRVEPFVQMSRAMGTGNLYILARHIVPNIAGPLIVQTSLSLAFAILSEAALSFLGLGIQPPQPSLGRMIFDSQGFVTLAWWMAVFPGARDLRHRAGLQPCRRRAARRAGSQAAHHDRGQE